MHLRADRDAEQRRAAVRAMALAGRQHRRHDHRAGMDRPALECVVEILAMRGGAVDEGRARGAQLACVPDGGAGPIIVTGRRARLNVVLIAGGDAEPNDVDQQILAFVPDVVRQTCAASSAAMRCSKIVGNRRQREAAPACTVSGCAPGRAGAEARHVVGENDDGEGDHAASPGRARRWRARSPLSFRSKISTDTTFVSDVNSMIAADNSRITPTKMKHQVAITRRAQQRRGDLAQGLQPRGAEDAAGILKFGMHGAEGRLQLLIGRRQLMVTKAISRTHSVP